MGLRCASECFIKVLFSLYRAILEKFGQGLLTVHEQLTVCRYFGDYKVRLSF